MRRLVQLAVGLACVAAGCSSREARVVPPAPAAAVAPLVPLGEATGAEFRRAFEEARDRPRLVVGLSPT